MITEVKIIVLFLLFGAHNLCGQGSASLETLADQILQAISELRALEPRAEVKKGVMSREEIEKVFRQRIDQEYDPEDLEKERRLLVKLGVLPPEYDYLEGTIQVLNEQVAGYYDPIDKTLFIADWLTPEIQQMTLAHELAHALQDQHYELQKILSGSDRNGDALMARRAIVEGDAVAVMFEYLLRPLHRSFASFPNLKELYEQTLNQQHSGQPDTQQLREAPRFIRESLLFAYVYGARFMQVYRQSYGWDETAGLYGQLPSSTEQIIHPEKYLNDKDDPTELDSSVDNTLREWEIDYSDTFGEFQTQLVMREFLSLEKAMLATAGWDGDRIRLLRHQDGRLALQWDTIWDSAEEAHEFRDLYAELIQAKYKLREGENRAGNDLFWETEFDRILLSLEHLSVRVLEVEKVPVRLQ